MHSIYIEDITRRGGANPLRLGGGGGSSFSENLTFNFNSLLGIVYVSFSMQFPTSLEECDFDRQFLFDEYVAISHRYDLKMQYRRKAK